MLLSTVSTVFVFVLFAVTDPDRLRSENYELNKRVIMMVEKDGTKQQRSDVARSFIERQREFVSDKETDS